jgi:predicted O-methyltransferase YrrM
MKRRFPVIKQYVLLIVATVPSVIFKVTWGIVLEPKKTFHFLERVLELKDLFTPDPVLPSKNITDICAREAHDQDVTIIGNYHTERSSDTRQLRELSSIAFLCRTIKFGKIFEIGTFVGRMTRLLALNAGTESTVYTLDLPQNMVPHDIGEFYRNTEEAKRIVQLHGDSTSFDYTPWHDLIDFCWVDACHDYEFAFSDTVAAFSLVKDGGWIGWHDYRHSAQWSGVTKAVREVNQIIGGGIIHVFGTTTAILQVTADMKQRIRDF